MCKNFIIVERYKLQDFVSFHLFLPLIISAIKKRYTVFGASTISLSRKQIKTKLKFCKSLFIVHVRVKNLLKVILEYKNEVPQLKKCVWHMHNKIA